MFTPPKSLVETIGGEERDWVLLTFPTFQSESEDDYLYLIAMVSGGIADSYRIQRKNSPEGKFQAFLEDVLSACTEALLNASGHGNGGARDKKIELCCWFGTQGVLLAIRDEGKFFTNAQTKELVESRVPFPSTRLTVGGDGMSVIYEADSVYVSTEENALYLLFLLNSP